LARYFEQQAERLHTAAAAIRRAERHSIKTIHNNRPQERAFLAYGARVAVLMRRGMSASSALAAMRAKTGLQIDVLRAALGHWRRHRRVLGMGELKVLRIHKAGPSRHPARKIHR
jgi:hypothetical protein